MPNREEATPRPTNVVYLWGAGATQAEVTYRGAHPVNLLMRDNGIGEGIATRILGRVPKKSRSAFATEHGMDIEKLISLLMACNVASDVTLAERLRRLYFEDICSNLATAQVLANPELAIGLLAMHNTTAFQEHELLRGIITTNHDGLLQVASQNIYSQVNLSIPFDSSDITAVDGTAPPILHLHGSFTWQFGLPLHVKLLSENAEYSRDTIWIPPTILKESKAYPFNKLAGRAYELLSRCCDVLRVVGSALTQNDWNVLSMIFNAQRHAELTKGSPFRIELIMPHIAGEQIERDCSYLRNLLPIGHLTEGDFASYKELEPDQHSEEMKNPLFYWLKEKVTYHQRRGQLGPTPRHAALVSIAGDAP